MIMYELLESISLDGLVNISGFQIFYLVLWFSCFVLYRIFLCLIVNSSAKERQVKCRTLWSILTFLLGVIVPIIYAIVNRKHKAAKRYKSKNVFIVLSIILIALSYIGGICYNLSHTGEFEFILDPEISFDETYTVTFKNNWGRKVILDKKGNEYTFFNKNELLYYEEDGTAYKCPDGHASTLMNVESQRVYREDEYDFYVNDDGYLCIFENFHELNCYENDSCSVYYDDEHLYFPIDAVNWDREGKIVFPEFIDEMNNLTYESVVNH